jgi:hypothetical protein
MIYAPRAGALGLTWHEKFKLMRGGKGKGGKPDRKKKALD